MSIWNSFLQSSQVFAIQWADKQCQLIAETTPNVTNFLSNDAIHAKNFDSIILNQSEKLQRQQKICHLHNLQQPIEIDTYAINGKQNGILYVTEEIIATSASAYTSIFTRMDRLVQKNQQLEEVRDRLELVLGGTRLGMWDWNPQTNDVVFDERWAEMLGLRLADLTQTLSDWQDRVHPDDIEQCFADISAHIDGKVSFYENTHRMRHSDGSWRYILDRGKVVKRDADGKPIRFTGTHTDVTELKMAEQQAKNALSARSRFFAKMSHEIRTPLHGILGTADILSRRQLSAADKQLVNVINDSGELLQNLLNDILDVAKLEEDAVELTIRPANLMPILTSTFKLFGQQARKKGLAYRFFNKIDHATVMINTDTSRLKQILSNTISNAIKFTDAGHVSLEVAQVDNQTVIRISDSGRGIQDTLSIFNPYKQEGTERSKSMGTGLGLSIVKHLCEKLAIDIQVNSTLGEGSVFEFRLGAEHILDLHTHAPPIPVREVEANLSLHNALVVDDNEINLFIAKTLLEEFFTTVDTALSGQLAIEMVNSETPYDVIFMDLNMPEMDGIEAIQRIQELTIERMPQIIAQTADATEEAKLLFEHNSVSQVITKPFTREKLIEVLNKLSH